MDWAQRKVYVSTLVSARPVQGRRVTVNNTRRKNMSLQYNLKLGDENIRVCKKMFLSTLRIGEWSVLSWVKLSENGMHVLASPSKRRALGLNGSDPKDPSPAILAIRDFLNRLFQMDSHYCRASTSKQYLEPLFLSMCQLYKEYKSFCATSGLAENSITVFRTEFSRLNLSLFSPKKDQCDICCSHQAGNLSVDQYLHHCLQKELARNEKNHDKQECIANSASRKIFTMDLQSVLLSPKLEASALYYKTKLIVHNFTLFDLATKAGTCYVWHEGQGGLTANDFASCICDFIESQQLSPLSTVMLWSDGCTYQNRNVILANALLVLASRLNIFIEQKFLTRGHTQMECDVMHSVIEKRLRKRQIYVPADYITHFQAACSSDPYKVKYLDHSFFKDYSQLKVINSLRPGIRVGDSTVTDMCAIRYSPEYLIEYKFDFSENWQLLPQRINRSSGTSSSPTSLYPGPIPIKSEKFHHLQQLKSVIPPDYHAFYDHLAHTCVLPCSHVITM